MWRIDHRHPTFSHPASLPALPVAFQAGRRVFRGRYPRKRRHHGARDSRRLLLFPADCWHELRKRSGFAFCDGAGVSSSFLSSQLEPVAGVRLYRGVAAEARSDKAR